MLVGPTEAQDMISSTELPHKKDPGSGRDLWFYQEEHLEHKAAC